MNDYARLRFPLTFYVNPRSGRQPGLFQHDYQIWVTAPERFYYNHDERRVFWSIHSYYLSMRFSDLKLPDWIKSLSGLNTMICFQERHPFSNKFRTKASGYILTISIINPLLLPKKETAYHKSRTKLLRFTKNNNPAKVILSPLRIFRILQKLRIRTPKDSFSRPYFTDKLINILRLHLFGVKGIGCSSA